MKTYVDVMWSKSLPEWPYVIMDVIQIDNRWEISAFIPRRNYVRIYFSYRWYQVIDMLMLKRSVKDYEKELRYHDAAEHLRYLLFRQRQVSAEELTKELARLTKA